MTSKTLTLGILLYTAFAQGFQLSANAQQRFQTGERPSIAQSESLIKTVSPAIVQFSYDGFGNGHQLHFGCGVIVSADGHIAVSGPVHAVLNDELLELTLTDGRKVRGQALGWSSELGIGMLKITEPGDWPFVKLSDQVEVGEVCFAIGYDRNHNGENNLPETRLAVVTRVSKGQWFTTSHQSDFSAHPVFSLRGQLLGLCVSSPVGDDSVHSCASVVKTHWKELASGQNLDRNRFLDDVMPPRTFTKPPQEISDLALARARSASVQIGPIGEKPFGSGVSVPGGYVITCAHHNRLPGVKMDVVFADGRQANAEVLGTNWLTDVCVLKLLGEEEWPFVDIGFSIILSPGDSVMIIGYPISHDQTPMILESHLITPRQTLKRRDSWSSRLYALCEDEQTARNLPGASGGGIFDSSGKVIGVLSSNAGDEMEFARVELFHQGWEGLVARNDIPEIDSEWRDTISADLKKLTAELEEVVLKR